MCPLSWASKSKLVYGFIPDIYLRILLEFWLTVGEMVVAGVRLCRFLPKDQILLSLAAAFLRCRPSAPPSEQANCLEVGVLYIECENRPWSNCPLFLTPFRVRRLGEDLTQVALIRWFCIACAPLLRIADSWPVMWPSFCNTMRLRARKPSFCIKEK